MASKAFQSTAVLLQRGDGVGGFVTIAEMSKIQMTGAKADVVDVTNMDSPDAYKEKLVTILDAGGISFDGNMVADDATQAQVQADFDARTNSPWKIVLPVDPNTAVTRGHWAFNAYVVSIDFDLAHDKQAMITGKLDITGPRPFTAGS